MTFFNRCIQLFCSTAGFLEDGEGSIIDEKQSLSLKIDENTSIKATGGLDIIFPDVYTRTVATEICTLNGTVQKECLFDIGQTLNARVGETTKKLGNTFKEVKSFLCK